MFAARAAMEVKESFHRIPVVRHLDVQFMFLPFSNRTANPAFTLAQHHIRICIQFYDVRKIGGSGACFFSRWTLTSKLEIAPPTISTDPTNCLQDIRWLLTRTDEWLAHISEGNAHPPF